MQGRRRSLVRTLSATAASLALASACAHTSEQGAAGEPEDQETAVLRERVLRLERKLSDMDAQLTALTGTTGMSGKVTYSTASDGKIYVENRLSGPSRTVSLFVIGAPLA